jgi:sn-glycerol 3-phosphate transport system substrate-binding protein
MEVIFVWRKFVVISLAAVFLMSFAIAAPVTINFWHAMSGSRIQLIQNLANEFMKTHPNIIVKVQYTGSYNDTLNKTIAAVKGGNPPDIVQVYDIGTQMMIDSGIIVPIQKFIDEDKTFDVNTLVPQARGYYTVGGKLYSLPFNSSNPVIFYNKTLFKKAGLDPNDPPTTWEEFKKACEKLTVKDSKGHTIQYGFTSGLIGWFFEQFMAVQNAPMFNNGNGRDKRATKAVFDSAAGLRIFNFWNDLVQSGIMLNAGPGWSNPRQIFMSQKAAMLLTSTSDVEMMLKAAKENHFDLGVMFLPHPQGVPYGGVIIGGASLWMIDTHNTAKEKAAWEFMKWLAGVDPQIEWSTGTGYFPINKNAIQKLLYNGYYAKYPQYLVTVLQLLMSNVTTSTRGGVVGPFPKVRATIEKALGKVFNHEMTTEEALKWAQDQANQAIADYNSLFQ